MTIALALLLVGVPAVTLAQTATSPSAPSSGTQDKSTDKPTTPSASPSTSGSSDTGAKSGGHASPAAPASAEDCKNAGWQKLGFKTEAECASKVKK